MREILGDGMTVVSLVIYSLIPAILYAFSHRYIQKLVKRIDEENALYEAQNEGEDENYTIWDCFVFGDIIFDFFLFRFVKNVIEIIQKKYKIEKNIKHTLLLGVWGLFISGCVVLKYGAYVSTILIILFVLILTLITIVDAMRMEIPPELNGYIFVLAILSIFLMPEISLSSRLIGMLVISIPMQLIVFAVPGGFGGGDIKLMFVAGLFLGVKLTVAAFFIGLVLGGAYGAMQLALRKLGRKEHFAFGPFLSFGIIVALFYGNQLIDWYLSAFMGR